MNILAFAASNSKHSINKQLVTYAAKQMTGAHVELLDINDYEMPIYSIDKETELGGPHEKAKGFFNKISEADALLISFAEHNGSYTAAYKNIFDWTSRVHPKVFQNKPMVLLATSPGPGGAKNVLAAAKQSAPHFHGEVKADLSVPKFYDVFDSDTQQLIEPKLKQQLLAALSALHNA